jgi:hypothetical protein
LWNYLAIMGAMNFVGTLASGWLTDRYDPRKLLAIYHSLRGLSLLLLPFVTEFAGLAVFAVFFGLDYIATVPPTVALVEVGAALASYVGGIVRVSLGDYTAAFLGAGVLVILASLMVLVIRREPTPIGPERRELASYSPERVSCEERCGHPPKPAKVLPPSRPARCGNATRGRCPNWLAPTAACAQTNWLGGNSLERFPGCFPPD